MSGIAGWFGAERHAEADERCGAIGGVLSRFDAGPVRTGAVRFGAVVVSALDSDRSELHTTPSRITACWGPAQIDAGAGRQPHEATGAAVTDAFAFEGPGMLNRLSGSFAIAILDGQRGEALIAVDRMGTRPMYYGVVHGQFVFGSSLDAVRRCLPQQPEVCSQAIYDYVYHHVVPSPAAVLDGLRRLLPGECAMFALGECRTRRYWQIRFVEDAADDYDGLKAEFMRVLRASVGRAALRGSVGAFLSGGTDSSTIAGMLGEVTGQPARTYSIGFHAAGYDEMSYARIAATHFRTRHHEYYLTPDDIVKAIPLIAAVHDQPFGNSSAIPAYFCAKLAKDDGVDAMLGGDGGDELFGGNERYAKQYVYSLYGDLSPALRRTIIEPVAFLLPAVGLIGKAQRYMRNAVQPMPERYENYNLLERFGAAKVFSSDFLAMIDQNQPRHQMAALYREVNARSLINRMLALDFKYTLADNDLPKVSKSCELAGVGVRYPMLDDEVVAFSANLRPRRKLDGRRLRAFFKDALTGYLPTAIIHKQKHGFGLPFGLWVRTHDRLRELAFDSLTDLKQRGIIRREFIDALTSKHLESHAAYYGTMVWVLMMLEQWFARELVGQRSSGASPATIERAADSHSSVASAR